VRGKTEQRRVDWSFRYWAGLGERGKNERHVHGTKAKGGGFGGQNSGGGGEGVREAISNFRDREPSGRQKTKKGRRMKADPLWDVLVADKKENP